MSTVAAISTPNAVGGIGIIRVSGEDAVKIADSVFDGINKKPLSSLKGYTAAYGTVYDADGCIDEAVVIIYRAPKSYTGENVAEICCHGGLFVMQRVLRAVYAAGALPAEAGEFTKRAFLNGKIDLAQAEGVMSVISAQGKSALCAAENTVKGNVSKKINDVANKLTSLAASLAAWADYPDEDIPAVKTESLYAELVGLKGELDALIARYDSGRAVTQGVNTVICGKPNVGKSTLMNLLSGFDRSIVTPVAGTTRDVIEETVRVGDILLRLADTAGLHNTSDEVESIGIDIAKKRIQNADLVIAVFDVSQKLSSEDMQLLELCSNKKCLAVINKNDLPNAFSADAIKQKTSCVISISAKNMQSGEVLSKALWGLLCTDGLDFNQEMLAGERQRECCVKASDCIKEAIFALNNGVTLDAVNVSIDSALEQLFALTGQRVSEQVVNEVFKRFCVGK